MCQCFAPTKLVVTFEKDGLGKFSPEELENMVSRDNKGNVYLNLPSKSVLIANHQVSLVLPQFMPSADIPRSTRIGGTPGARVTL